jgi:hypothetical protein
MTQSYFIEKDLKIDYATTHIQAKENMSYHFAIRLCKLLKYKMILILKFNIILSPMCSGNLITITKFSLKKLITITKYLNY